MPAPGNTGVRQWLTRQSDIVLAAFVVAIIGIMIIKVPTGMMDALIGTNIAIAATVLLVALYVPNAMKLPAFPTILLLTTLFRLGLNVATTRLILLEADAGRIIDAFGEFVVGGNFVVGGVVFIVLVIVQFVVIAKGSERVAEVSARFTLDAMPGKQMSIDADLRAGLIDPAGARQRRQDLEKESKLYGAMDGAMKFVKGDAIAGIIISMVNIVGGLIIGVMQLGMTAGDAAQTYALLTIGDGLVSQIPALLISVSAGLVVTRVASGGEASTTHVAQDMFSQVLSQPKAIGVVAVVLIMLGLLPGFPMWVFWVLALVAAMAAFGAGPQAVLEAAAPGRPGAPGSPARPEDQEERHAVRAPMPIVLELHSALVPLFIQQVPAGAAGVGDDPARGLRTISRSIPEVQDRLTRMRKSLEEELGLPLPPVVLRPDDRFFALPGYAILFYDAPVASAMMMADQVFLSAGLSKADAEELGLKAMLPLPWTRIPMPVVVGPLVEKSVETIKAKYPDRQVFSLPARDVIIEHVRVMITRHAADFLGIQETSNLLEQLKETRPDAVKAVVPVLINPAQVTEVLKGLLAERIAIKDLRLILESIAKRIPEARQGPSDPIDLSLLTELVRYDLRRAFCAKLAPNRSRLPFYSVAHDLENAVAESIQRAGKQTVLALSPQQRQQVIKAFAGAIDPAAHLRQPAVIVVNQPALRRPLWNLLQPYLPEVVVLAYQDLTPELSPQAMKVVMLDGES